MLCGWEHINKYWGFLKFDCKVELRFKYITLLSLGKTQVHLQLSSKKVAFIHTAICFDL